MKRVMTVVAAIAASVMLVGCGGKPKVPADAVVAAYIDLGKGVDSVKDVSKLVIKNLPKEFAEAAKGQYEQFEKMYQESYAQYRFDWALFALCSSKVSPSPAPVLFVRCDYAAAGKDGQTLKDILKGMFLYVREDDKFGVKVFNGNTELGWCRIAFVDEKYLILSTPKDNDKLVSDDVLERAVALYKDGKGETSNSFGDIADLGDDTVARIQIADADFLIDNYGMRETLEKFGKDADDEDLVEMLADVGNITLDLNFTDDTVGGVLSIDAGSAELAKLVEGAVNLGMFAKRVSLGIAKANPEIVKGAVSEVGAGFVPSVPEGVFKLLKEGVEAERSGTVVTVTVDIDTDDLVEEIVEAAFPKAD